MIYLTLPEFILCERARALVPEVFSAPVCHGMREGPQSTCAVTRRRVSSGCKPRPATAPAGSDRSRHGGDEVSEAFG